MTELDNKIARLRYALINYPYHDAHSRKIDVDDLIRTLNYNKSVQEFLARNRRLGGKEITFRQDLFSNADLIMVVKDGNVYFLDSNINLPENLLNAIFHAFKSTNFFVAKKPKINDNFVDLKEDDYLDLTKQKEKTNGQ